MSEGNVLLRKGEPQVRRATLALPVLVFGLLFASDAFAYLDPGTGSILLQGFIAAVAAAVTWLSLSWQQAKAWVRAHIGKTPPGPDPGAPR
jgi:hypothetical protein